MGELNGPAARSELGVPADKRVFLFYGTGARRKGLHLAVRAMRELPPDVPAFLLCAGQLNPEGETARELEELVAQKRARLINRYVTAAEEKLAFAASDVVLLPYLHHFGNSGVLSRAMAAGRMVIVSDEELLGRMTRTHNLGLLFPSGDVPAFRARIEEAARLRRATGRVRAGGAEICGDLLAPSLPRGPDPGRAQSGANHPCLTLPPASAFCI